MNLERGKVGKSTMCQVYRLVLPWFGFEGTEDDCDVLAKSSGRCPKPSRDFEDSLDIDILGGGWGVG